MKRESENWRCRGYQQPQACRERSLFRRGNLSDDDVGAELTGRRSGRWLDRKPTDRPHRASAAACWRRWLMAGADLFWEKSTAGWLLMADLLWEKNTAGWWLISQGNSCSFVLIIIWSSCCRRPARFDHLLHSSWRSSWHEQRKNAPALHVLLALSHTKDSASRRCRLISTLSFSNY
jgi:hypothetical protein